MDGSRAAVGQGPPGGPARMNRVLHDSSLYLLGNVAGRVVGFLTIPFYASYLSPAQYGLIELVELSTQTIAITFGLQAVGSALSRLFHDQRTAESEQAVVSTSLIATAVLSAVVTLIAVLLARPLSEAVFHTTEWASLLQAAFVAMFFSNMIEVVLVYERIRNNAGFYLAYALGTLAVTLGLNILFIGFMGMGVWGFVTSKLAVSSVCCVWMAVRMRRDVGWRWRSMFVPGLVRLGAPLILSSLSYFAIHFSDRFFLSASVGLADLGRYALAYKFAMLVSALVGDSFAKSWSVTLYQYVERARWREEFARVASYLTYVLFGTGLGIALFSPELLQLMVPADYLPPQWLLPIVIASYLAREIGDFFRSLLLINKRAGRVAAIAASGALLNLVANAVLIPRYGIYGAAFATLLTWLVYMVVCWIVANHEHRLPVKPAAYFRITALLAVVYFLAATTRSTVLPLQVLADAGWLLLFAVAALALFFNAPERRGALGLAGSMALWGLAGKAPLEPVRVLVVGDDGPAHCGRLADLLGELRDACAGAVEVRAVAGMGRADHPWRVRVGGKAWLGAARFLLRRDRRFDVFADAFADCVGRAGPGTVVLSIPPSAAHLVALALRRRCGSGWVADLRGGADPSQMKAGETRADRLLERATLESADVVLVAGPAAAEDLQHRYPAQAGKVRVVHSGATDLAHVILSVRADVAG